MTSTKPGIATVPPPTLEKQLELLAAARSLATQDDEFWRQRRAEIAAIRRDAGKLVVLHLELQRQYGEFVEWVQEERRRRDPRLRSHVIRYNPDQPRVPAGNPQGGERTSTTGGSTAIDAGNAPAAAAPQASERGPQYAQASTGTMTDATGSSGNTAATEAQQNPKGFFHDLVNVTVALIRDSFPEVFGDRDRIWSSQIPLDSSKRPVWLVGSSGQPILDGRGSQLVGPQDLPPETYVQVGLDAKSRNLAGIMHLLAQGLRGEDSDISPEDENRKMAALMNMVTYELLPFAHAGSFDAERFDNFYVRDYRPYTSVALGIYMAAAGVSREDMLTIADFYAGVFSSFHENMDPNYPHSTKQDIQDNLLGYELYESGRIRLKN